VRKILFFTFFNLLFFLSCNHNDSTSDSKKSNHLTLLINNLEKDSSNKTQITTEIKELIENDKKHRINYNELNKLLDFYFQERDWINYKFIANHFYEKSIKFNDKEKITKSYRLLGNYNYEVKNLDSAYLYFSKCEKIYQKNKKTEDYCVILFKKSLILFDITDYNSSYLLLYKAFTLNKKSNNNLLRFNILNQLGLVSRELNEFENASAYFKEATILAKSNAFDGNSSLSIISESNLALLYQDQKKYDISISLFKVCINKESKISNPTLYANILNNIGYCYLMKDDYKELPNLFFESLKIRDSLKDTPGTINSYINISRYYNKTKKPKQALVYANKALTLARKSRGALNIMGALQQAGEVDSKNALKYTEEYITINDSLQLLERKSKDQFARIQLETNEIKQENTKLESEKQFFLNILFGIVLGGSLLVLLMVQQAKTKKLQLIKVQHDADERIYQSLLQEQSKLDDALVEERKRIAREIHDDILGRLFGLRLSIDSSHMEESPLYSEDLQNIEKDLRKISHELYDKHQVINNFEASITSFLKDQQKQLKFPVKISIDKKINWQKFSNIALINVYRIVQESYYNIAKYAQASQVITKFKMQENGLLVEIIDNGKGFNVAKTRKGIGISNMYDRIKESNGTIEINSSINQGTQILITIPKDKE